MANLMGATDDRDAMKAEATEHVTPVFELALRMKRQGVPSETIGLAMLNCSLVLLVNEIGRARAELCLAAARMALDRNMYELPAPPGAKTH